MKGRGYALMLSHTYGYDLSPTCRSSISVRKPSGACFCSRAGASLTSAALSACTDESKNVGDVIKDPVRLEQGVPGPA